jgi:hypothetical protein
MISTRCLLSSDSTFLHDMIYITLEIIFVLPENPQHGASDGHAVDFLHSSHNLGTILC